MVAGMMLTFSKPESVAWWSLASMVDLRLSIAADMDAKRLFAWQTRLRQVEEIYIRALYVMFIATDAELPHILSGEQPNSLVDLYRKVNEAIFNGQGIWETAQPGQSWGQFKPIDILHNSAHASFAAMSTAIGFARDPDFKFNYDGYKKHLENYCVRLEYMHMMFKGGKSKADVMDGVIALHRPASYWQDRAVKDAGIS
jgi:hypothetical protein